MKKLKLLLSLSILFFTFYSCTEQLEISNLESLDSKAAIIKPFESLSQNISIDYCGEEYECTLWAGQNINAGNVTVSNDSQYLYVKVYSKAGFQDAEENIKMWIGTDLPSKRPPAGKFPYKVTESSNTHIFKILLSSIDGWVDDECEQQFYIIVHADVLTVDGDPDSGETAFGGCEAGNGKAWWYYMDYTTACCEEEEYLDVFAFKNPHSDSDWSFCFLDDGFDNWGWTIGSYANVERYNKIKLKIDGQIGNTCKPRENTLDIGYVEFWIDDPSTTEVHFKIVIEDPNYKMYKSQVYIGENKYPNDGDGNSTIDPNFYGNSHENIGGVISDTYTIGNVLTDFYIIIHADVRFEEPITN